MKGNDFVGYQPQNVQWLTDNKHFIFDHRALGDSIERTYVMDLKGSKRPIRKEDFDLIAPANAVYSPTKKEAVFQKDGDLFIWNISSGKIERLTKTKFYETEPQWTNDGTAIAFRIENDIYLIHLSGDGPLEMIASFGEKSTPRSKEASSFLKDQQMELFQVLKDRDAQSARQRAYNSGFAEENPPTIPLNNEELSYWKISLDGKSIWYSTVSKGSNDKETQVPNYVTKSGYTQNLQARPKVGELPGSATLHYFAFDGSVCKQIDLEFLTGIHELPAYRKTVYKDQSNYTKKVLFFGFKLNSSGNTCLIEAQSLDNKDRWIFVLQEDKPTLLDHQHDEAWIGGPGISSWRGEDSDFGWISENTVFYQSEKTGYSHLYTQRLDAKPLARTSGNFEVMNLVYNPLENTFFFNANFKEPGDFQYFKMSANDYKLVQISDGEKGFFEASVSPDGKSWVYRYSNATRPWELYAGNEKSKTRLTFSTSPAFEAYKWRTPEVVYFPGLDGKPVYARVWKPANGTKGSPAVVFVHGAGYLQNAHYWWSNYYRENMFHNFLADNGYTVIDIDYRASSGYGRDWRTGIYRHMGGNDLNDQIAGKNYLVNSLGCDSSKVGIYGGSYGGFITLMALFTSPGTFKCGAALRSVTDWAHYNHGYTSNILNTPELDPEAFRISSPIYFAENLKDRLLILHGMVDVNVHFQDVVRLNQRLIELKKDNWEMAVFPVEDHGFKESTSWYDEYRRIYLLFEETLK